MSPLAKVILLATLASASLTPRDYNAVYSNLTTLNSDADKLQTAANNVVGGSLTSILPLSSAENKLLRDTNSTTHSCASSPAFTTSQSGSVSEDISSILVPKLRGALNAVISKKSTFVKSGVSSSQVQFLAELLSDTDRLSSCLVSKAPSVSSSRASATAASRSLSALVSSANSAYRAAPTGT